jgi:hypothetical protein
MLLGIDLQIFDIGAIDKEYFYIKFHLCTDEFKWALVALYGSAQDGNKEKFLVELLSMCSHEDLPMLTGDDYNTLRHPSEKNNDHHSE